MSQISYCHNCGAEVRGLATSEGRTSFRCSCGKRWKTQADYGRDTSYRGVMAAIGSVLGGMITGGLDGGLVGAGIGACFGGGDTSECIRCGGTGFLTGQDRKQNRKGYQCQKCKRYWTEKA